MDAILTWKCVSNSQLDENYTGKREVIRLYFAKRIQLISVTQAIVFVQQNFGRPQASSLRRCSNEGCSINAQKYQQSNRLI